MGIKNFWKYISSHIQGETHPDGYNKIIIIDGNRFLYSPGGTMDNQLYNDFVNQPDTSLVCGHNYSSLLLAWSGILKLLKKLKLDPISGACVYIAFDGRPPTNKYYTQNHRRLKDQGCMETSFTPYTFNAVHMEQLLRNFLFTDYNTQSHYFQNINMLAILSSHIPGEGEYKVIEILNDEDLMRAGLGDQGCITVVSDDSDLILHALYSWGVSHQQKYKIYVYRPKTAKYYNMKGLFAYLCQDYTVLDLNVMFSNIMFLLSFFATDFTPQLRGYSPTMNRFDVIFDLSRRCDSIIYESVESLMHTFKYLQRHIKKHLQIGKCENPKGYITDLLGNVMWMIQYMRHVYMDWKDVRGIFRPMALDVNHVTPIGINDILVELSSWTPNDISKMRLGYDSNAILYWEETHSGNGSRPAAQSNNNILNNNTLSGIKIDGKTVPVTTAPVTMIEEDHNNQEEAGMIEEYQQDEETIDEIKNDDEQDGGQNEHEEMLSICVEEESIEGEPEEEEAIIIDPDNVSNMWYLYCVYEKIVTKAEFKTMYQIDENCIQFFQERLKRCNHMLGNYCDPIIYCASGYHAHSVIYKKLIQICNKLIRQ